MAARSVALRDFPCGQLVVVRSGLFSGGIPESGEKEESSRVELRPCLHVCIHTQSTTSNTTFTADAEHSF